jgi:hypothetical protein
MVVTMAVAFFLMLPGDPPPDTGGKSNAGALKADPAWKELERSLWFDRKARRLIVRARVVLREGVLEHLVCLKGTKEHEAILATDASPRQIHAGLLLTGAEPGHPVRFVPQFEPPTGTPIAIEVIWRQDGTTHTSDVRQWVKDEKTKRPLAIDWVFAGSELFVDPVTKKTLYAADDGDLITVANFGGAILDLPIASSANDAERVFSTNTEKIPALGTEVFLSLGPRQVKSKEQPAAGVKRP